MMGQLEAQEALFYEFQLESYVPADHLVRKLDRLLDLSSLRGDLAPYYSHTGRPSIDPELMIRMLILGYCFGIRSERRLCDEVNLNLAYRWFCKLDLDGRVPNHWTFSHNRYGRFEASGILRRVFEGLIETCLTKNLIEADTFVTDASMIKANASSQSGFNPSEDRRALSADIATTGYLETLNDTAFGAATTVPKKRQSTTDPAAQWTVTKQSKGLFAYSTNYLIDAKHAIIVDVEGSRAVRQAEMTATNRMIERTESQFGLTPKSLAADSAYGSAKNLDWLVTKKNIDPYVPVWDKSKRRDGTFSRSHVLSFGGMTRSKFTIVRVANS